MITTRKIMTSCNNCGHPSHCGVPCKEEFCAGEAMILVCAHCRCDKCEVIDDEEIKWGDGI
jgi:hypothetical protein